MPQFNLLVTSHLHVLALFCLFLVLANHHLIAANSLPRDYDYLPASPIFDETQPSVYAEPESLAYVDNYPDNDRFAVSSNSRARSFPSKSSRTTHLSNLPIFNLRNGLVQMLYKKRTIPLELQKALYAHGIVGRRR